MIKLIVFEKNTFKNKMLLFAYGNYADDNIEIRDMILVYDLI